MVIVIFFWVLLSFKFLVVLELPSSNEIERLLEPTTLEVVAAILSTAGSALLGFEDFK